MRTRREFIKLTAGAGLSLSLPGCAASPPLRTDLFPDFGDAAHPYLGLATSLREEHDYEAKVEGDLPAELRGTFYRIGPALFDRDGLRRRTLLDGDGMMQSFAFHGGGVRYRNRFVRTKRYVEEEAAGRFIYPSWCTQAPGGIFANFWRAGEVSSQASVTVYHRNGRLYAFDEGSLPWELDPVSLATVGETTLGLPREMTIYAAHSKVDPRTGEWVHFGIRFGPEPSLHITIFAPDGSLRRHRSLPLPRFVYMHDWFVTDRWLVFNLQPVTIHFWWFLLGVRSMVDSLRWEPEKGNLLMVVERDGLGDPAFVEAPPSFMWHAVNAYRAGGEIIADFVGYDNPDHLIGTDPAAFAVMQGRKGQNRYPGMVRRYVIDPARKSVASELIAGENVEWPRVNELHRCSRYRFAYLAQEHPGEFFWSLVSRVDVTTGRTWQYDFGQGNYCSEPVFVPIPGKSYEPDAPEEPGWLLTEVYDSASRKSSLAVLRAERVAEGPLAWIRLNHHVPFSYHGWWHAEED